MADDLKHRHLLKSSIEHIEMDYLKAIGEGPGWPVLYIADLDDPAGLDLARQVDPAGSFEAMKRDALSRGVAPVMVFVKVLEDHYDVGDHWWKGCDRHHFPVCVTTSGSTVPYLRSVPDGVEDALRQGLAVENAEKIAKVHRHAREQGLDRIVVIVADLSDETVAGFVGEAAYDHARQILPPGNAGVAIFGGSAVEDAYPGAWGGPIPDGQIAVEVISGGGVLYTLLAKDVGRLD